MPYPITHHINFIVNDEIQAPCGQPDVQQNLCNIVRMDVFQNVNAKPEVKPLFYRLRQVMLLELESTVQ